MIFSAVDKAASKTVIATAVETLGIVAFVGGGGVAAVCCCCYCCHC